MKEDGNYNQTTTTNVPQQPQRYNTTSCWLARQQQQVPEPEAQTQMQSNGDDIIKCPIYHGADPLSLKGICTKFVKAFRRAYYEASNDDTTTIMNCVFRAKDASSMDLPTCGMIRPRSKCSIIYFVCWNDAYSCPCICMLFWPDSWSNALQLSCKELKLLSYQLG